MTNPTITLDWVSIGTEEPGDQQADSGLGGHYEIGPAGSKSWSVTLILLDRTGGIDMEIDLGRFESEAAAKAAATDHETEHVPTSPSGLTYHDDCDDTCVVHSSKCDGYCDHGDMKAPHRNACLPDMTAPSTNENCLDGIRCPRCGNEGSFRIAATSTFLVVDDGTEEYQDVEWDSASRIDCTGCYHSGTVADFTITPAKA